MGWALCWFELGYRGSLKVFNYAMRWSEGEVSCVGSRDRLCYSTHFVFVVGLVVLLCSPIAYVSIQHILYLWYPWNGLFSFNAGIHKSSRAQIKLWSWIFVLHYIWCILFQISCLVFTYIWKRCVVFCIFFSLISLLLKKKKKSFAVSYILLSMVKSFS